MRLHKQSPSEQQLSPTPPPPSSHTGSAATATCCCCTKLMRAQACLSAHPPTFTPHRLYLLLLRLQ